jgi:MoaA/NifB/PqqE/SkfB family radical SAM enzyme
MNILGQYENGNYKITIYDDGTKIRESKDDIFISKFPECIDLKITNFCDINCSYCHEDSNLNGKHGNILNAEFVNTLHPFTELALGGGNALSHPNLKEFLQILKSKNIIANMTVNQKHFISYQALIKELIDEKLIRGLGISLIEPNEEFINLVKLYDNAVIHVINGVVNLKDLEQLYNNNFKILILGYKEFRRGKNFYSLEVEHKKKEIYDNICNIVKGFNTVSFDNLAIKQLELKRIFSNKDWNEFYMGDDGQHTMYIDLVKEQFALNSTSEQRYNLLNNIEDMFKIIKG